MQSKSTVQDVQSSEEFLMGIFGDNLSKFRPGQLRALLALAETTETKHEINFPTGYGKTSVLLGGYVVLRERKLCNRMLILVPTDDLRTQTDGVVIPFAKEWGVTIGGSVRITKKTRELRYVTEGQIEVFIATYQQGVANEFVDSLLRVHPDHRWFVGYDESHKVAAGKSWGGLGALNAAFQMFTTATPIRSDGLKTVAKGSTRTHVGITEGIEEQAIRQPTGHIEDYYIDVTVNGDSDPTRLTAGDLGPDVDEDFQKFEQKRRLRYIEKYTAPLLTHAIARLAQKNQFVRDEAKRHRMMVFCMSNDHAKSVNRQLNRIAGDGFSDWVGVDRPDFENEEIKARFRKGELECVCVIDMMGIGYDHPNVSVLAFLHLTKAPTKLLQQIGRGQRLIPKVEYKNQRYCDVFAGRDTAVARVIDELEAAMQRDLKDYEPQQETDDGQAPMIELPDSHIVDVEWYRTERVSPGDTTKVESIVEGVKGLYPDVDEGRVGEIVRQSLGVMDSEAPPASTINTEMSESSLLDMWQGEVKIATRTLVSNIFKAKKLKSGDTGVAGDIKKAVNRKWVMNSRLNHDNMVSGDYKRKYDWLQELNNRIAKTKEVPLWLPLS